MCRLNIVTTLLVVSPVIFDAFVCFHSKEFPAGLQRNEQEIDQKAKRQKNVLTTHNYVEYNGLDNFCFCFFRLRLFVVYLYKAHDNNYYCCYPFVRINVNKYQSINQTYLQITRQNSKFSARMLAVTNRSHYPQPF